MKRIVTAIAFALASCATAPATAYTSTAGSINDAMETGERMCHQIGRVAFSAHEGKDTFSYIEVIGIMIATGSSNKYTNMAVDLAYEGEWPDSASVEAAARTRCMSMVNDDIMGVIMK